MYEKSSSNGLRWTAAILLALSSIPMAFSWLHAGVTTASDAVNAPEPGDAAWVTPGEIDVQLKPGTDDAALADLGRRIGAQFTWNSPVSRDETEVAEAVVPANADIAVDLATLRADSRVAAADVAHVYRIPSLEETTVPAPKGADTPDSTPTRGWRPNDPRFEEQWNFKMVHAEEAWEVTRGKGAIVAVIDTGVAYEDSKRGKRAKDFGDTQFVPGYDFVHRDSLPFDDNAHGTHVAGTIAESTNNGEGVAGLAFEAKIMPLKVLSSSGSGTSRDIAEAIRWAADHHANVINMSLGSPLPDQLIRSACEYAYGKGVTIVCAAGNSGHEGVGYPAAYKECIAVSSVGPSGNLSHFSTWGRQIAIAAPGGDKEAGGEAGGILQNSVKRDDNGVLVDDYYSFQGTSMASPHVAAVAALIVAQGIKKPADVRTVLLKSAQSKGPANKYGAGIVDAAAAAKLATNTYSDGITRFWIVVALFGGCMLVGKMRAKTGVAKPYPFWGTAALCFGLLFPDWITQYIGATSPFNIVGHSILVPGALLILGAQKGEKRLLGWMALGLSAHLGWEFVRGTSPFGPEITSLELLPWIFSNLLVGAGMMIAGLAAPRD